MTSSQTVYSGNGSVIVGGSPYSMLIRGYGLSGILVGVEVPFHLSTGLELSAAMVEV